MHYKQPERAHPPADTAGLEAQGYATAGLYIEALLRATLASISFLLDDTTQMRRHHQTITITIITEIA